MNELEVVNGRQGENSNERHEPMGILEHALLFMNLGWSVFPIAFKEKKPLTKRGFKDASTDKSKITRWFKDQMVNVAIATGGANGIAVLDIDKKSGGYESLDLLKTKYNLDMDTLSAKTGGGGLHFYYRADGTEKSRTSILPGVDIKANGGYIIAPPSVHPSGVPYEFHRMPTSVEELKPFPKEIIERLDKEKKRDKKKSKREYDEGAEKIFEGSRNSFLFSQYGRLRGMGLALDDIRMRLHEINTAKCIPPLVEAEVEGIITRFSERSQEEILIYAPQTDLGNAERFKAFVGDDLIFVQKMKKWHVFDKQRYVEDDGTIVIRMVKEMLRSTKSRYGGLMDERGAALGEHLRKAEKKANISALLSLAESELAINPLELDKDPFVFNVLNGTIDLRSGTLRPHSKRDRLTKLSSVMFDPMAKCPRWLQFLSEVFPNAPELADYFQRVVGYCLTGSTKEQCFWILYGLGSNGKSKSLEIIKRLLGDYAKTASISTFTCNQSEQIRNDLARLHDARMVTSVEIQEGKLLDESIIKQVTGGDPVTCRFLFKEHFEYVPKWKLMMSVNHLPHINGTDNGIWRRTKCIPFLTQFEGEKNDPDIVEKLEAEISGILNWAIEGCLRWQREGLSEPKAILEIVATYRRDEDLIEDFLTEYTTRAPNISVNATYLFKSFATFQKAQGQRVISQKLFAQKMASKGFRKSRGIGGRVYYEGLDFRKV